MFPEKYLCFIGAKCVNSVNICLIVSEDWYVVHVTKFLFFYKTEWMRYMWPMFIELVVVFLRESNQKMTYTEKQKEKV